MSIIVQGKVTLEEIIPVVLQLSEIEQEELKQILQKRRPLNWNEEWDKVTAKFHRAFEHWPQEEVIEVVDISEFYLKFQEEYD